MNNFPVFVFPVSLEFYLNARHTHKQLLTVYNPYEFQVNYRVLCTSPNKFTVLDPEGVVAPQSCVDIVVRYTQPSASHCNTTEKFRITIYDRNTQQTLGKKDVAAKLVEGEPLGIQPESRGDERSFHPMTSRVTPVRTIEEQAAYSNRPSRDRVQQPVNVVALAIAVVSIAALFLPTQPDKEVKSSWPWPEWLHIGSALKMFFCFVIGLVFTLIVKPLT